MGLNLSLPGSPKPQLKPQLKGKTVAVEEIGGCVVCKLSIFSDQSWGRAPKPLLGKAHTELCGGIPDGGA